MVTDADGKARRHVIGKGFAAFGTADDIGRMHPAMAQGVFGIVQGHLMDDLHPIGPRIDRHGGDGELLLVRGSRHAGEKHGQRQHHSSERARNHSLASRIRSRPWREVDPSDLNASIRLGMMRRG